MTISFNCEHCGKRIQAPDDAGGRRGRCPHCKLSNYIPTPVSDEDIYDLAEPDDQTEQEAAAERERLRRQEEELLGELGGGDEPVVPLEQKSDLKPEDLHPYIVNYCLDVSNSNLERAEQHVAELRKVRRMAVSAVDDFLSGKALEPALESIPTKLLQGFLKQLRERLSQ
jgi:phage FluMu protein Com